MSTYVYAIVRADHPFGSEELLGVGEPGAPVRLLTKGALAAAVSDAPEGLRAKRRDLLAHQKVIGTLSDCGPVLPMRFGSLSPHDDAVRMVLAERGGQYAERLRELEGRVEFNVKATHREDIVLRRIVSGDQRIRELNARTRAGGANAQQERLRLGELVAAGVREQETRDSALIRESLRPLAEADSPGPEMGDCLCNFSFLVDSSAAEDFRAAVSRLEKEHEHLELSLHGPLPPYSFVESAQQRSA
ncbi:GvpL/GvpF family gas vesicle protein [Wenjunlia tyrosinilytica]|uniref:Gas vesicle protein n=1 Tax=Wenjunlia tyrosinilytica TaxID=1544741 RepID=A0A917ZUV7_9ACTN|nr:GvpL/GvpF family gas vesicle protein [Wenjunlia tyrosinilytica]GGO95336.1 gas vesicle protein [Wenjunlia tyrosinilytica]